MPKIILPLIFIRFPESGFLGCYTLGSSLFTCLSYWLLLVHEQYFFTSNCNSNIFSREVNLYSVVKMRPCHLVYGHVLLITTKASFIVLCFLWQETIEDFFIVLVLVSCLFEKEKKRYQEAKAWEPWHVWIVCTKYFNYVMETWKMIPTNRWLLLIVVCMDWLTHQEQQYTPDHCDLGSPKLSPTQQQCWGVVVM